MRFFLMKEVRVEYLFCCLGFHMEHVEVILHASVV